MTSHRLLLVLGYPKEVIAYRDLTGGSLWPGAAGGFLSDLAPGGDDALINLEFDPWGPVHSFELTPHRVDTVVLYETF